MATGETHYISNQPVFVMQCVIGLFIDRGVLMPAECFQRFMHKLLRLFRCKTALRIKFIQQLVATASENIAFREDLSGFLPQRGVFD